MKTKKLCALLAATLMLLALAAGCNQQTAPAQQTTAQQSAAPTEAPTDAPPATKAPPVNITIAHCQGEWMWPVLKELGDKWSEASGNTVEFIYAPADSYSQWVQAQFAAGTEPDALFNAVDPLTYFRNGKLADLTEYYNLPNKYNGEIWKDTFREGALENCIDKENGNKYFAIPTTSVTVCLFYNKDLMQQFNIDETSLSTWSAVLGACQTVTNSGQNVVPFAVMNSMSWNLGWIHDNFMEELWINSGIVESLDVINPNGELENNEVVLGLKSRKIKYTDERFVAYFDFIRKLSGHFNKDFNSISWEYEGLFNNGTALMFLDGSWYPNQVLTNNIKVNYGTAAMPYVDNAIYAGARNEPVRYAIGPGEVGNPISMKAKDEGRIDACIDFYQYLTDAATGAKLFVEKTMFIPTINGVQVPDSMKGIMESIGAEKKKTHVGVVFNITAEHGSKFVEAYQKFLGDPNMKTADFCRELQTLGDKYVDIAIGEVPEYSKIPDYVSSVK
jgi:ABC-type glycerol-3-phosphate transport system substrate-binding protein